MYSTNRPAKSVSRPPLRAVRLLDQLRERLRYEHYSLRTEEAYVYWARAFIRFHGLRHPRDMGPAEVTAFLGHLAAARQVSAATRQHKQLALRFAACALSADSTASSPASALRA